MKFCNSRINISITLIKDWTGFDDEKDIVLTPALTCFATTVAVLANNVNIRWIDVDLETVNIVIFLSIFL